MSMCQIVPIVVVNRERNTSVPYKVIGPVIGVDANYSTAFNMNGSEFSWWCGLWTVAVD